MNTYQDNNGARNSSNGMGLAGFVLALLALIFSWTPFLGWIIWFFGAFFSFIGLFKRPKGFAVAGCLISLIDLIVLIVIIGGLAVFLGSLSTMSDTPSKFYNKDNSSSEIVYEQNKNNRSIIHYDDAEVSTSSTIDCIEEDFEPVKVSEEVKQTLESLVQEWYFAHFISVDNFAYLFDDFVLFYGTKLSSETCLNKKKSLLQKYPDFQLAIIGSIDVVQIAKNECKCSFTKRVTINNKTTDYPSYLIFKEINDNWKIIVESDLVTDKNLAKRK